MVRACYSSSIEKDGKFVGFHKISSGAFALSSWPKVGRENNVINEFAALLSDLRVEVC